MNRIRILLSIFLFFIFIFGFRDNAIGVQEKIINVIPYAQKNPSWCWAASAKMIMLHHFKDSLRAPDIFSTRDQPLRQDSREKKIKESIETFQTILVNTFSDEDDYNKIKQEYYSELLQDSKKIHEQQKHRLRGLPPVLPDFSKYGFRSKWGGALEWSEIVKEIINNRPFGFSWIYDSGVLAESQEEPGGGHYMVAIGYQEKNGKYIWIIDPTKIVMQNGQEKKPVPELIPYDEYVEYYDEEKDKYLYSHYIDQYEITRSKPTNLQISENYKTSEAIPEFKNSEDAAEFQVKRLKEFPENFWRKLGFKSKKELRKSSFRKWDDNYYNYKVSMIGIADIKFITQYKDPNKYLIDLKKQIYPVYSGTTLKTAISIKKGKDRNGNEVWKPSSIGGHHIFALEKARQEVVPSKNIDPSSLFTVRIPAISSVFLGYKEIDKLILIPTHKHQDPDIKMIKLQLHEPIPAHKVFRKMRDKKIIEKYQNFFTPLKYPKKKRK